MIVHAGLGRIKMLFKKLYYYYHHYKMWSYIVKQLKMSPREKLSQLKADYIKKNNCKHLSESDCYLCSYVSLIKTSGETACIHCPLYKKYDKDCYDRNSLFLKAYFPKLYNISTKECIAAAEKIRDCVLPWKKEN